MIQNKKVVALIPLRGGSKSIPLKNIKKINGKPLAYWVCAAATASQYIDAVYVSTDADVIKNEVNKFNLGVEIINRPKKYAQDASSTESVMLHFAQKVDFDVLVMLQATSPLTTAIDIDRALESFVNNKSDSLVTGVLVKRFFWNLEGKPLNYNFLKRPRRQDFKGTFMENGAFYVTRKNILQKYKNRLGGKINLFVMDESTAVELDEPHDWKVVSDLLKLRKI